MPDTEGAHEFTYESGVARLDLTMNISVKISMLTLPHFDTMIANAITRRECVNRRPQLSSAVGWA